MASDEVLLGSVTDADGDEIQAFTDEDGTVILRPTYSDDIVLGRTARDALRELLDRAAMPGQVSG